METQLEKIFRRYNLTIGEEWMPLMDWIEKSGDTHAPAISEGVNRIDAEELIRLIMLLESSAKLSVRGASGSVEVCDDVLLKYLRLSLHKLLQLRWGMADLHDWEKKAGRVQILTGYGRSVYEVSVRDSLDGEDAGFIQPYSENDLETLLDLAMQLRKVEDFKAGRGNKKTDSLGNSAVHVKGLMPEEVRDGMSVTEMLNFIGDMMDVAGLLSEEERWKKLTKDLERCERLNYDLGEVRRDRKKIVENWVNRSKKVWCDLHLDCEKCETRDDCSAYLESVQSYAIKAIK